MSRRTLGITVKGDATEGLYELQDRAMERLRPWHIDRCHHYGEPCGCPSWKFDQVPYVMGAVSLSKTTVPLIGVAGLASYVNLHDEWYDRDDCTDFDQVVRTDMDRVAEECMHTVLLMQIHYIAF